MLLEVKEKTPGLPTTFSMLDIISIVVVARRVAIFTLLFAWPREVSRDFPDLKTPFAASV